jgi:hypothetical protein
MYHPAPAAVCMYLAAAWLTQLGILCSMGSECVCSAWAAYTACAVRPLVLVLRREAGHAAKSTAHREAILPACLASAGVVPLIEGCTVLGLGVLVVQCTQCLTWLYTRHRGMFMAQPGVMGWQLTFR